MNQIQEDFLSKYKEYVKFEVNEDFLYKKIAKKELWWLLSIKNDYSLPLVKASLDIYESNKRLVSHEVMNVLINRVVHDITNQEELSQEDIKQLATLSVKHSNTSDEIKVTMNQFKLIKRLDKKEKKEVAKQIFTNLFQINKSIENQKWIQKKAASLLSEEELEEFIPALSTRRAAITETEQIIKIINIDLDKMVAHLNGKNEQKSFIAHMEEAVKAFISFQEVSEGLLDIKYNNGNQTIKALFQTSGKHQEFQAYVGLMREKINASLSRPPLETYNEGLSTYKALNLSMQLEKELDIYPSNKIKVKI